MHVSGDTHLPRLLQLFLFAGTVCHYQAFVHVKRLIDRLLKLSFYRSAPAFDLRVSIRTDFGTLMRLGDLTDVR